MSITRDPMDILDRLRPVSAVERYWPGDMPPEHHPAPARRSRTRRLVVVAALTAALVGSGTGIAAATGLLPESFTGTLSFWTHETNGQVDVQNARRVAQEPGPNGTVLSVWTAHSANGTMCVAPMFEAPGPLDRPAPAHFRLAGGSCTRPGEPAGFGSLGGSADKQGVHTMWGVAGDAVRADLVFPGGRTRPALRAVDRFFFWYVADAHTAPPSLVGYDAAGKVVAQLPLPDLNR